MSNWRKAPVVVVSLLVVVALSLRVFHLRQEPAGEALYTNTPGIGPPTPAAREDLMKKWFSGMGVTINKSGKCDELLPPEPERIFKGTYTSGKAAFDNTFKVSPGVNRAEGYSGQLASQTWVYHVMARNPHVRTICETGFNGGHSTYIWLSSHPTSRAMSFDLGSHPYSHTMNDYLNKLFPGRLTVTFGDSTKTLPVFKERIKQTDPNFKCDIIVVDGGHTHAIAKADMDNFRSLAKPGHSLVILDDYPSTLFGFGVLGKVWEDKIKANEIAELFRCTTGQRGFTIGYFL